MRQALTQLINNLYEFENYLKNFCRVQVKTATDLSVRIQIRKYDIQKILYKLIIKNSHLRLLYEMMLKKDLR